jgi:3-oxoadipate enol-lactonase
MGLGLVASQAGADTEEGRQNRYKLADKVAAEGSAALADAMLPKLFAASLPAGAQLVEEVRKQMLATRPEGIIGTLKGMAARPDSTPLLPQINVPALVLAGAEDTIVPLEKAEAMAAALPHASLTTVQNAGHMPMLEQPEATTRALAEFLGALKP